MALMLPAGLASLLAASAASASPATDPPQLKVLVFGDSQGALGPSWRTLQHTLNKNGVNANVVSKAVSGTLACGWAATASALADAAKEVFPDSGPDFVWYTAGGNDMEEDKEYHTCLQNVTTDAGAKACLATANKKILNCTSTLLDGLWEVYPSAKVGMYNYEVPCFGKEWLPRLDCMPFDTNYLGGQYCAGNITCVLTQLVHWQTIYVDALQRKYKAPKFTGMNLLGAVQAASGIAGASPGHPVMTAGSDCLYMIECVHPTPLTPTATAVGDAMWNMWLSNLTSNAASGLVEAS
jgi:hypothetical protein